MNFNSVKPLPIVKSSSVVEAEDIKSILFLGIRSELPSGDSKRKVDIII